jgi:hypothetical protein
MPSCWFTDVIYSRFHEVPTGRNLMGSMRVTERAKPPAHLFPIHLLSKCSFKNSVAFLPTCGGAPPCVGTVVLVSQKTHTLNNEVFHFP